MKTKQYAAHPLTTTQSELPSAILSALTIALLSALLFTSCSKHHYLELFLDPDGEPIENPGRILLSAPGVANPLLPAILTDPARKDRIVATVLHDHPVDVEAGTYNLLCALPTDGSNTEYFGTDAFTLNGTTISLPLLAPDGRLPQAPDVLTDATPVTVTSGRTIQTALTPAPRTRLVRLDVRLQGADASSITAITARLEGVSIKAMRSRMDDIRSRMPSGVAALFSEEGGKANIIVYVSKDLHDRFTAPSLIKQVAPLCGGSGGGRPDMAQAGGTNPAGIDEAMARLKELLA